MSLFLSYSDSLTKTAQEGELIQEKDTDKKTGVGRESNLRPSLNTDLVPTCLPTSPRIHSIFAILLFVKCK